MQRVLLILVSICCYTLVAAQADSSACIQYRKGYFSYTDSLGNTVLVDRHKKYQYEKNTATKVKTQFRITWINSCSYQIMQTLTNSRAARKYKYSTTVIVIEKAGGSDGYSYSCNCAGVLKKETGYMKKLSRQQYYSLY